MRLPLSQLVWQGAYREWQGRVQQTTVRRAAPTCGLRSRPTDTSANLVGMARFSVRGGRRHSLATLSSVAETLTARTARILSATVVRPVIVKLAGGENVALPFASGSLPVWAGEPIAPYNRNPKPAIEHGGRGMF